MIIAWDISLVNTTLGYIYNAANQYFCRRDYERASLNERPKTCESEGAVSQNFKLVVCQNHSWMNNVKVLK